MPPTRIDRALVVCDVIYKTVFRFSKIIFFYFILIMLIYERNQTFCSKSVKKKLKKC